MSRFPVLKKHTKELFQSKIAYGVAPRAVVGENVGGLLNILFNHVFFVKCFVKFFGLRPNISP